MLFNSFEFLVLLSVTFLIYYLPLFRARQVAVLLLSSLAFYGWHQPILLFLLLFSILVNAVSSHRVYFGNPLHRRQWATLGVVLNLGLLIFFKYSGLLYQTFRTGSELGPVGTFLLTVPLPVGISFFTFQGISLVVDTYRSVDSQKQLFQLERSFPKHLVTIAFFKSFFPQLVSGPIVKAHEFLPQIHQKYLSKVRWEIVFKQLVLDTAQAVRDGHGLTELLQKHRAFPSMAAEMLATGERTGKLEDILSRLSTFYTREIDNLVTNMVSLIEPMIMVLMGLAVGVMVSAIILPMYNLANEI